jgi:5-methyltetrahydrofolate--homocysteine methyltransferase
MKPMLEELKTGKILLSDGAMGTELQRRGLPSGACPEEFNVSHSEIVAEIHQSYIDAGSDIIQSNTFGANRARLKLHGFENRVEEFCTAAVNNIKRCGSSRIYIAGSIGPIGEILEPLGELKLTDAYDIFSEQAKALAAAGADVLFIETMMAAEEIEIAIKASKENTNLPVSASMTFELGKAGLRTMWGVDVPQAVQKITEAGADIIGSNCGKGFDEMIQIIAEMRLLTNKPILAQSNAGIPEWVHGISVYHETPEMIGEKVVKLLELGANIIGGCCGTGPEHIRMMREIINNR